MMAASARNFPDSANHSDPCADPASSSAVKTSTSVPCLRTARTAPAVTMAATAAFMSPDPRPYSSPSSITEEKGSCRHAERSPAGFVPGTRTIWGPHRRARDRCEQVGPVRAAADDLDVGDAQLPQFGLSNSRNSLFVTGWVGAGSRDQLTGEVDEAVC